MFLSRYQDRPSTLKVESLTEQNGRKGTIHSLNEFNITVWDDGEVTAQRDRYASTSPDKTFPNMSIVDGCINFPIEDLVSFILQRVTAEELAEGILADDEAREALVYKMAERYASPGFEDADRRKFLAKVQQQVHSASVDRAVERLNHHEQNARSRSDYYRWRAVELGHYTQIFERYTMALYELREAGVLDDAGVLERKKYLTTPEQLEARIKENRDPIATESVGPQWHESRNYWREELKKFFPEPEVEA